MTPEEFFRNYVRINDLPPNEQQVKEFLWFLKLREVQRKTGKNILFLKHRGSIPN
ncbi:MAG: hypothetical protein WC222_11210 [Parachlamydiales bacterium]|jgi:hypothetical protein